jgi:hypothetical protein
MRKPYESYSAIPPIVKEYILTVAEQKCIMSIPLEDINSFLDGPHEYYSSKKEVEMDGWAS